MPELAEVEAYRRVWDCGLKEKVAGVDWHRGKRIFRGIDEESFQKLLTGATLMRSETRGKQMLFCFSNHVWLGIHLGMTGSLRVGSPDFAPAKHDHLVLRQKKRALVFNDPRLFGRVLFYHGAGVPPWWAQLAPSLTSDAFTLEAMTEFLSRHPKLSLKAALLSQSGFPGVGNWMADEILWRARLDPQFLVGRLDKNQLKTLWRMVRFVCEGALKHVKGDFSDLPKGWLFNERWSAKGKCPIHAVPLKRATVGGRTTAWCPVCQP